MNIKVQKQKPGPNEGAQGEMRLVLTGRGAFLYVRGGNQWHSLNLSPTISSHTHARMNRGSFQRNTLTIAGDGAGDHNGTILPGGPGAGTAPPDEPR